MSASGRGVWNGRSLRRRSGFVGVKKWVSESRRMRVLTVVGGVVGMVLQENASVGDGVCRRPLSTQHLKHRRL